jgi:hypothetical protein
MRPSSNASNDGAAVAQASGRLRVVRDSVDGRCLGGEGADALMGELGHGVVSGDTVDGAMKDQLLGVTLWSAINTA